jgi:hypothetical protein
MLKRIESQTPFSRDSRTEHAKVVISDRALSALAAEDIERALVRHLASDWGDAPPEDIQAAERAFLNSRRVFSMYHSTLGLEFWIITKQDSNITFILMPDEY